MLATEGAVGIRSGVDAAGIHSMPAMPLRSLAAELVESKNLLRGYLGRHPRRHPWEFLRPDV
jgi:hypothetical protein